MSKIPIISGHEAIKVFEKVGYKVIRQKGSHIRLRHEDNFLKKTDNGSKTQKFRKRFA